MKVQAEILEMINTVINIINTLIILIPAVTIYLYHKLHIVDVYILEKSNSGIVIGIHNITAKSLLFSDCNLIIDKKKKSFRTIKLYEFCNDKFISIKSDEIHKISLDYNLMNIESIHDMRIVLEKNKRKIQRKLI